MATKKTTTKRTATKTKATKTKATKTKATKVSPTSYKGKQTYRSFDIVDVNEAEDTLSSLYDIQSWEDTYFETIFGADPDMVKIDGYITYFSIIPSEKLVVVSDLYHENKKLLKMWLTRPLSTRWQKGENWSDFHKASNAIAYRGGSGYIYDIEIYTGKI